MLPGTTVAETPLATGVGAVTPPDAGGDVVMTMLAVPDESDVPGNWDCSSNYKYQQQLLNDYIMLPM